MNQIKFLEHSLRIVAHAKFISYSDGNFCHVCVVWGSLCSCLCDRGAIGIQSSASRDIYYLTEYAADLHRRGFPPPQMSTAPLLGNTELGPIMWVASYLIITKYCKVSYYYP